MIPNTTLTGASAQSRLMQLPTVMQNVTLPFLTPEAARALAATCKYFHAFLQTEEVQRLLLAIHYPLFRPSRDSGGELVASSRSSYERLTAAHSRAPGIDCCKTIPIKDVWRIQISPDKTKLVIGTFDDKIALYELATGECLWTLPNIYPFRLKGTQENRIESSLKSNKKSRLILSQY